MMTGALLSGQRLGNFCWLGSINSPFPYKTSVWFLEKQCCIKQRTLGSVASLVALLTYLTSVCCRRWLLIPRDREQGMLSSRQRPHTVWEGGGGEAKPTIAELKIHDRTRSSHMTTLIEEIIWSTGGITVSWSWICPWTTSITHIFPPRFMPCLWACLDMQSLWGFTFTSTACRYRSLHIGTGYHIDV